jgi:hypothetical protein
VLDQVAQERIGQPLLVRPLGVSEDAIQRLWVGAFNPTQRLLQRLPDVGRHRPHVAPMAALRNLEAVVLREQGVLLVATGLRDCRVVFLVVNVRETLEEQQRKDVGLEVRRVHGTA